MSRLAFFVDGQMEQRIIQRICPGTKVLTLGSNGQEVQAATMARKIASLFRLLGNRYYPVFVIVDRESRKASAQELKSELIDALCKCGVPGDQLKVVVADRMIENWILADPACAGITPSAKSYEGKGGKGALKSFLERQNIFYHETTMGVDLFCKIDPPSPQGTVRHFGICA